MWLAVVLPAAFWGLSKLGDELAHRRGESTTTKVLRTPRRLLNRAKAA